MPQFAANLTMLYADSPFLDRFARARAAGFSFVEYLFPYEYAPTDLARALAQNQLTQVLFNLPAGNWSAGDRGIAAHPDRVTEFRHGVTRALEYASVLRVKQINCLVGKRDEKIPLDEQHRVMIENLRYAARALAEQDITLLVEHLNPYDVPGFLLVTPQAAFQVQDQVAAPNLKIQYDIYHAQRTAGELAHTLEKNFARIAHIQIADNPGRHQPGTGEINYRFVFQRIDQLGYTGYIGLEYAPQGTTEESLGWVREYGYQL